MNAIEAKRKALLRIKQDLKETFGSKTVRNADVVFVLSNAKPCDFATEVFDAHMRDKSLTYFSVLALDPGVYAGEKKYADALQTSFGGNVRRTENRHIAEWVWERGDSKTPLDEVKAFTALFNVV